MICPFTYLSILNFLLFSLYTLTSSPFKLLRSWHLSKCRETGRRSRERRTESEGDAQASRRHFLGLLQRTLPLGSIPWVTSSALSTTKSGLVTPGSPCGLSFPLCDIYYIALLKLHWWCPSVACKLLGNRSHLSYSQMYPWHQAQSVSCNRLSVSLCHFLNDVA